MLSSCAHLFRMWLNVRDSHDIDVSQRDGYKQMYQSKMRASISLITCQNHMVHVP